MFRVAGVFFMIVGLFLLYFGAKDVLRILEFRINNETVKAVVLTVEPYTKRSKWGTVDHQEVVFRYVRKDLVHTDTMKSEYAGDRNYLRSYGYQKVGDSLVVRFAAEPLFFKNRFNNNDKKEITDDGEYVETYSFVRIIIGLGFSFIGFVFVWFFKIGIAKE